MDWWARMPLLEFVPIFRKWWARMPTLLEAWMADDCAIRNRPAPRIHNHQNSVIDLGKANDSSKFDSLEKGLDRRVGPDWLRSLR